MFTVLSSPCQIPDIGVSFSSHDPSLLSLCPVSSPKGKSYIFMKYSLPFHSCKYLVTILRLHCTLHFFVCLLFLWWVAFLLFLRTSVCLILRLEPGSLQQLWPLPLKCTPSLKDSFLGLAFCPSRMELNHINPLLTAYQTHQGLSLTVLFFPLFPLTRKYLLYDFK